MSGKTFGDLNSGHQNNFDFLRFVLATLVIVSHSFALLEGNEKREFLMQLTGGQMTEGELAVNGFFVLSGFLIAQSWENSRGLGHYLRKRVLRIFPGFLVAALFSALVAAPLIASSSAQYWAEFSPLRFALGALNLELKEPNCFDNMPVADVNGSLWSIRYEFFCYLGLAFLGKIGAFRWRGVVAAAFCLCIALFAAQLYGGLKMPGSGFSFIYCWPERWPRMAGYFLSGTLFYLYRHRIPWSIWIALPALAGIVVLANIHEIALLPIALPFLGTYLFFYVAYVPSRRLQRFAARGDFSYGMYLYAFPTQQLLVHEFGNSLTPLTLFLLAFPLTALLAMISWFLVEKRFLVKKQPRSKAPQASPALV